ncbi:hypothetical protein BS50DRAFT_484609 [Corynespora cassiicola Philippines]|uniref:Mitochondrial chaperone BCS1 n=1 Tax=Corynespora cassiicola Philippines TaxID=1448308 RepID=A0A2T2P315_CORCC|nr:hypothetical protein BS50DRAFT_484609 [Corynespora cassiicola Philippines]
MNPNALASSQTGRDALAKQTADGAGSGINSYFSQFTENPFFTAGFGLAALATAARVGQKGLQHGASLLRRHMLVDLEITRSDQAYPWLLQWMNAHQRAQLAGAQAPTGPGVDSQGMISSLVRRINPRLHHLQVGTFQPKDGSSRAAHFAFVPGQGKHILRYGGSFIYVDRQRERSFNMSTGEPFETITLTTLYAHRGVFEHIFAEAHQLYQQGQEGKTTIYNTNNNLTWEPFGQPKRKRPLDSIILERGVKERIVEDVQSFIAARNWYLDRGIPYRRGYLLHGPPGTGKTSFIEALAGHLDYNIAILNVSQRGLTDDRLAVLLTKVPPRSLILLEDIDVAFANRRTTDADGYSGATVTFSGLLNALDGVVSAEERIVFLTTNYVERLDEALIRPGRVDLTLRLGKATQYQIDQLWDRFYGEFDESGEAKQRFMTKVQQAGLVDSVSTAELQGLFLYNKDDVEGAIRTVEGLTAGHHGSEGHADGRAHVG